MLIRMFTIAIFKGVPTTPFDSSRTHAWAYHGSYTSLPFDLDVFGGAEGRIRTCELIETGTSSQRR